MMDLSIPENARSWYRAERHAWRTGGLIPQDMILGEYRRPSLNEKGLFRLKEISPSGYGTVKKLLNAGGMYSGTLLEEAFATWLEDEVCFWGAYDKTRLVSCYIGAQLMHNVWLLIDQAHNDSYQLSKPQRAYLSVCFEQVLWDQGVRRLLHPVRNERQAASMRSTWRFIHKGPVDLPDTRRRQVLLWEKWILTRPVDPQVSAGPGWSVDT